MARNLTRSNESEGRFQSQSDAIPRGLLIVLAGVMAWAGVIVLGSGIWHFLVVGLVQSFA